MTKIEKFFFGAAMKHSNGAASPDLLSKAIVEALETKK
jgi:Asp-tRNA(Asn)/Glu-tRNA(Gln) amidotransferase B subunit